MLAAGRPALDPVRSQGDDPGMSLSLILLVAMGALLLGLLAAATLAPRH
jgi:hypothetical protein